jgi:hypothetical protein
MSYKLSPSDGAPIEKVKADKWIKKYRDKHPDKNEIIARFYGKDIIEKIFSQEGCVGIRIYSAIGDSDEKQFLIVGAKEDGSNIWPSNGQTIVAQDAIIADASKPCPPYCPQ